MEDVSSRLPPITAALVIEMSRLEVARDASGQDWCLRFNVGAIRKKIGVVPERRHRSADAEHSTNRAYDESRMLLAEMCRACPLACPAKRW